MADALDPKETVTIAGIAISTMWEIAALLEVLCRKGILSKQEVLNAIQDLRRKNPQAVTPDQQPFPEPYVLTEIQDRIIQQILDVFVKEGVTTRQAKSLLGKVDVLLEVGERVANRKGH